MSSFIYCTYDEQHDVVKDTRGDDGDYSLEGVSIEVEHVL